MEGAAGPPTQRQPPPPPVVGAAVVPAGQVARGRRGHLPRHHPLPLRRGDPLLPPPLQAWRAQPVISYTQRTWKAASGEPMHAESGYWRPHPDGFVEVVIAQSTGLAEVQKGSYDTEKKTVTLQSELVGNVSKVKQITRAFQVVDGELSFIFQMATVTTQLQPHLKALKKI